MNKQLAFGSGADFASTPCRMARRRVRNGYRNWAPKNQIVRRWKTKIPHQRFEGPKVSVERTSLSVRAIPSPGAPSLAAPNTGNSAQCRPAHPHTPSLHTALGISQPKFRPARAPRATPPTRANESPARNPLPRNPLPPARNPHLSHALARPLRRLFIRLTSLFTPLT